MKQSQRIYTVWSGWGRSLYIKPGKQPLCVIFFICGFPWYSQCHYFLSTRHMYALRFKCISSCTCTTTTTTHGERETRPHAHTGVWLSSYTGTRKKPSFDLSFPTCSNIKLETQGESELLIKWLNMQRKDLQLAETRQTRCWQLIGSSVCRRGVASFMQDLYLSTHWAL